VSASRPTPGDEVVPATDPVSHTLRLTGPGIDASSVGPHVPLTVALDDRKRAVLRAIVTEFVARGEPVGSRRVVEVAALDVSPATVRNEMVALEELGLIVQPHTSAGRVPTDRGYRAFVDALRGDAAADDPRSGVVGEVLSSARDVEDLLARTSTVLSQLTRLVALVISPAVVSARLKLIELVELSPRAALLLLVSDTGAVDKHLVELPAGIAERDLDRVRTMLAEQVSGRRLAEVAGTVRALVDASPSDLREVVGAVADAIDAGLGGDAVHQVFVGGQASLAGDEALERDELGRLLRLLEERSTVARALAAATGGDDRTAGDGPTVRIGEENEVEDLRSTSLVAQRYHVVTAGSLGVIGPTRMDYAQVLTTVRMVADQLQRTLDELAGDAS
jgi:heat-inducible transcriptional repressor